MTKNQSSKFATDEERLRLTGWIEVMRTLPTPCWEWKGYLNPRGYGRLNKDYKYHQVHRVAYTVWVGEIPNGCMIRHKCDNRGCINPDHLEPGTHADNMRDMAVRHRADNRTGVENTAVKLSEANVYEIRKLREEGFTMQTIADKFGICTASVSNIQTRTTWSHI